MSRGHVRGGGWRLAAALAPVMPRSAHPRSGGACAQPGAAAAHPPRPHPPTPARRLQTELHKYLAEEAEALGGDRLKGAKLCVWWHDGPAAKKGGMWYCASITGFDAQSSEHLVSAPPAARRWQQRQQQAGGGGRGCGQQRQRPACGGACAVVGARGRGRGRAPTNSSWRAAAPTPTPLQRVAALGSATGRCQRAGSMRTRQTARAWVACGCKPAAAAAVNTAPAGGLASLPPTPVLTLTPTPAAP
jgi:hypothetical protein